MKAKKEVPKEQPKSRYVQALKRGREVRDVIREQGQDEYERKRVRRELGEDVERFVTGAYRKELERRRGVQIASEGTGQGLGGLMLRGAPAKEMNAKPVIAEPEPVKPAQEEFEPQKEEIKQ